MCNVDMSCDVLLNTRPMNDNKTLTTLTMSCQALKINILRENESELSASCNCKLQVENCVIPYMLVSSVNLGER